jgi:hypothetical protein
MGVIFEDVSKCPPRYGEEAGLTLLCCGREDVLEGFDGCV